MKNPLKKLILAALSICITVFFCGFSGEGGVASSGSDPLEENLANLCTYRPPGASFRVFDDAGNLVYQSEYFVGNFTKEEQLEMINEIILKYVTPIQLGYG